MSETYFDTGILVDTLAGHHLAMAELRRVARPWISRVTWLEIMGEVPPPAREETEAFLANFAMREVSPEIARRAATLRFERPALGLGAALVLATAQEHGAILVTRNIKDFPAQMPGIRVPYSS
ncbi:MAG: PIN domain-containing protein [Sphingomonadales bacterium]|nr:PIN domain-containing protein [Sphingomonadales bacterium]